MSSAQAQPTTGSKGPVSGDFALIDVISSLIVDLSEQSDKVVKSIESEETELFKDVLYSNPAWKNMVDDAKASFDGNNISFIVMNEGAKDAEYGNPMRDMVASGLIRKHARSRAEELEKNLVSRLVEGVGHA